jgi:Ca-activated chloride channel family protein
VATTACGGNYDSVEPMAPFPLVLILSSAAVAGAQLPRFSSGTDLVILSATAVDRRGRPVTDLRRDEVRIFEDGRPQKVEHFSQGRTASARLLLLLDASGSMTGELKTASTRMAAMQILAALDPEDEAALAAFDHKYWGVVAFTRDRHKVEQAMAEIESFGATALHDALARASSDLASHGEGRRAVVVLTDGIDTASQLAADDVLARSQALDVPIYAVSVVSPLEDPQSPRFSGRERPALATTAATVLARYAELSGGAAFTVSEFSGLQAAAARIVSELKQQYRLGYDPPPGPPRFRRIDVRSTRKGVVVRTRRGYVPRT